MRLVTRACLTQEQQPPENFARVDYFLIQDLPGYQGMLDTGAATQTSCGRVGCHTAIYFLHTHAAPGTAIILPGRASLALRYHCELPSQRGRNLTAIGADYFLIQDSPGYQGTLDTRTAALNLTWEGWLHTGECYHCFCRQSVPWLIIS